MEKRTSVIEEGSKLTNNPEGDIWVVESVEVGKHGLLCKGHFSNSGNTAAAYFPYELPPAEDQKDWFGWAGRGYHTLENGQVLGHVDLWRSDPTPRTIYEYDVRWERTLETMRLEQMSGTHTPNNTLQSRPFTEQSRPDVF